MLSFPFFSLVVGVRIRGRTNYWSHADAETTNANRAYALEKMCKWINDFSEAADEERGAVQENWPPHPQPSSTII